MCLGPQSDRLGPVISKLCIMPCQCRYVCSGEACSFRSHWGSTPVALIPIFRFLFFSPDATIYLNRLIGSFLLSPFPALLFLSLPITFKYLLQYIPTGHTAQPHSDSLSDSLECETQGCRSPLIPALCHQCTKPLAGLLSDHGKK